MIHNKTIAVVVPAYNEEQQIQDVIKQIGRASGRERVSSPV